MAEEEKKNGIVKPDITTGLDPNIEVFDASISGRHVISRTDGTVSENPLEIYDRVKSDNMVVYIRKTSLWIANLLVLGIFAASTYAQLGCVPPRVFQPPAELIAIILGIYMGSSSNLISKIVQAWQNRNAK